MLEFVRRLVQPLDNVAAYIQHNSSAAIGPAHVRYRYKERSRQAVQLPDLAAANSKLPGESHRPDIQRIGLSHDPRFKLGQHRIRACIVNVSQELAFCEFVSRRTVAAEGDPNEPWTAAFALGPPNRIENTYANAFEISVNAFTLYLRGQAILRAHVFAAAPFQDQPDVYVRIARLFPVENRTAWTQVIARVLTVDAVH